MTDRLYESLRQDLSDAGDVIAVVREALDDLAPLVDDNTGRIPHLPNARAAVERIRRALAAYDTPPSAPPAAQQPGDGRLRSANEALAHRRRPIGGWPDGGRVADRARTCAACGDEIWTGEHVYPADASGDTSDAAGVQCAVCEVQTRDAYEGIQP